MKKLGKLCAIAALLSGVALAGSAHAQGKATAVDLRVNSLVAPLAVENGTPKLSWTVNAPKNSRNVEQSAYQVQAATSKELLNDNKPDLWDSGKVESSKQIAKYAGKIPQTGSTVFWRVGVWNSEGELSWSKVAKFEFGLLKQEDWTGPWIGMDDNVRGRHAPYFRTKVKFDKDIASARAYVSGLGWFQLYVNGKQIGDHAFDPPQTDYDIRCMYVPFDITSAMKKKSGSETDLTVLVGDGWYNQDVAFGQNLLSYGQPRLRAQFVFTFTDGTQKSVPADLSWKTRKSAIVSNNVYAGEYKDANQELTRQQMTADEGWDAVVEKEAPGGIMTAANLPVERKIREVKPVKVEKKPGTDNVWIYDFGENLVGWVKLNIDAKPGTTIRMQFAEKRKSDGEVDYVTCGGFATLVTQCDIYIPRGNGPETWEPKFTYHGFQYMELFVEGELNKEPDRKTAVAQVVHTDMPVTGSYESSDENLNRLHDVAVHTYLMGAHALPMDCPVRERCGWTGDAHTTARMAMMNFDAAAFFRKYVEDIETGGRKKSPEWRPVTPNQVAQEEKPENVPHMIAPGKRRCGQASPDWGCAITFIPWQVYCATGDESILTDFFPQMESWVEYLLSHKDEFGLINTGLGEWCAPAQSLDPANWLNPRELGITSTAMFIHSLDILSKTAEILGDKEKAKKYADMAMECSTKMLKHRWLPEEVSQKTQTALGLSLAYLKDTSRNDELMKALLERSQGGSYFEAGVYGTPAMMRALNDYGEHEVAYKLLTKPEYPSYRAMLDMGATSLWEAWPTSYDALTGSMSHPFHGGYDEWIYSTAGIEGRHDGKGPWIFKWFPLEGLTWAKASIIPPAGKISSGWKRDGEKVSWTVEIPANNTGEVYIPAKPADITESGKSLEKLASEKPVWLHGVKEVQSSGRQYQQITLGSGTYKFEFTFKK